MNSKSFRIIKQLCDGNTYRIVELADKIGISARMIRYEVEKANSFLLREGFSQINSNRSGICLPVSAEEREKLQHWLAGLSVHYVSLTAEERKTIIMILLLSSEGFLTSQHFADVLGVSKSCIDKDLSFLKDRIQKKGVQLFSKPGSGVQLSGDERRIREICLNIIEHELHFADYLSGEEYNPGYVERQVQKSFCNAWFTPLIGIAHDVEQKIDKKLSYNSFRNLVLSLCVALTRISMKHLIPNEHENQALLQATQEYQLVEELSEQVQADFGIEMPVYEKCGLTVLLVGAKYSTPETYLKEDWVQVQILTDRIIRAMSKKLNIPFYNEEDIYTSLQAHLGPVVFRLKNNIPSINPILDMVKRNYKDVFLALDEVIQSINSPLLEGIQDDDISFLSLHFCASVVRRKHILTVSHVAIVCVHGVGTAALLKELVCSRFKSIRIVAVTTGGDLDAIKHGEVDFIISSIPLPECEFPWVQVNPILTEDDFSRIEKMIEKYSTKNAPADDSLSFFNDVISTIEKQGGTDNMPLLIESLAKCFDRAGISIQQDKVQPTLAQLLPPEKIRCHQIAADWEEAVRLVGSILVDTGDVTEDFIQSMIDTVKNAGPYIVVSKGVALVHGEVGCGVNRLAMSMLTLKEPVPFHHPTNDPVRLILCLAPIDNSSHVSALEDFIHLIRRQKLDRICNENNPAQLNKFLHRSVLLI